MSLLRGLIIFSALIYVRGTSDLTVIIINHGQPLDHNEKIVGGDTIDITQAPYQLQIEDKGRFICGASLLKPNYAISAAHCFEDLTENDVTVRAGTSYQADEGVVVRVSKIIIHESFNLQESYDYDIAVLKLAENLGLGPAVQTIEITNDEPAEGAQATVTGWGQLYENGPTSYELQSVTIPVQNTDICSAHYAPVINFPITERMFCAGVEGKDACLGDSGGPLVISGRLAGITSFGGGCARADFPGVYVKVAALTVWILQNTSEDVV